MGDGDSRGGGGGGGGRKGGEEYHALRPARHAPEALGTVAPARQLRPLDAVEEEGGRPVGH